jgi:hypothetical protein
MQGTTITISEMCVQIFSASLSKIFLVLIRIQQDGTKLMCTGLNVKYLLFLSDLNRTLHLSTDFRNVLIKFCEHPCSCSMQPHRQTDRWFRYDEAISRLSQFCKCASDSHLICVPSNCVWACVFLQSYSRYYMWMVSRRNIFKKKNFQNIIMYNIQNISLKPTYIP